MRTLEGFWDVQIEAMGTTFICCLSINIATMNEQLIVISIKLYMPFLNIPKVAVISVVTTERIFHFFGDSDG